MQIGGVNGQNVPNLSGGWQHSFNLATSGQVTLSLRYNLSMVKSRTDRFGQVLASIDGVLKGISPADYIVQLAGTGGGGTSTTGWVQVQITWYAVGRQSHSVAGRFHDTEVRPRRVRRHRDLRCDGDGVRSKRAQSSGLRED